jgi:lysylphosphatidylglycerol synthetase-like protein (DUF2156 family)
MRSDFVPTPPEELQFKRTSDGWVYTMLSPWILAPRRSYLVSSDVKPVLTARVRQAQSVQIWIIVPLVLLLGAVVSMYPQLLKQASILQWLGYAAILVAVVALPIIFANYFCVRDIVRNLPRTNQGVPYAEHFTRLGEMFSTKGLAGFLIFFALITAFRTYKLITAPTADAFTTLSAILPAITTIGFLALLIQRLRAERKPNAAENSKPAASGNAGVGG